MAHWYNQEGGCVYKVVNKSKSDGSLRDTTLSDAKKLSLLPSVTEILKVPDKPGLTRYFLKQAYDAMAGLTRIKYEEDSEFIARAKIIASEHSQKAMNLGTDIHDALESHFKGTGSKGYPSICKNVDMTLQEVYGSQEWIAEASFGCSEGFGGKVDLSNDNFIVDYKTKDFDDPKKKMAYEEMGMQLMAYKIGLNKPNARLINVFVSTTSDLVVLHEWDDHDRLAEGFRLLLSYWKWMKKFDPSF